MISSFTIPGLKTFDYFLLYNFSRFSNFALVILEIISTDQQVVLLTFEQIWFLWHSPQSPINKIPSLSLQRTTFCLQCAYWSVGYSGEDVPSKNLFSKTLFIYLLNNFMVILNHGPESLTMFSHILYDERKQNLKNSHSIVTSVMIRINRNLLVPGKEI